MAGGTISEDVSAGSHAGADRAAGADPGPATEAFSGPATEAFSGPATVATPVPASVEPAAPTAETPAEAPAAADAPIAAEAPADAPTAAQAPAVAEAPAGPATESIPAPPPPQPGEPGWLLGGRYRVIDRIGAGGMAEVFRAHDQLLARDVAVKVFRAHTDPDEATGGVQRQELELQTLARLSHPNLITLFDGSIGSDGEPAFLVMELISGPSLAAQIAQSPLTEPETREIAVQIAGALAYVHSQHMVHRDIKPANILLGADGTTGESTVRARLSDFGIVRLLGSEHLTSADFMVGTASYLAPEQARGAEVGPAADIYALGLVLIEALTGQRSYQGPALEAVLARLDRSPEIPAGLPQPWPQLLTAMTAMDPDQRPNAAEVARTLRDGVVNPVPSGNAVLAGDAVLAAGAPLAAAAGVAAAGMAGAAGVAGATGLVGAGTAGAGNALADATLAPSAAGSPPPAYPGGFGNGQPGNGQPGYGNGQPGFGNAPELPTTYIPTGLPPMPPPDADDVVDHLEPDDYADDRRSRGPLVGVLVAGAALIAAVAAGGLLLVHGPSSKNPAVLPGQSVSSGSSRQPVSTTPSKSATSVAPVGSVPSSGAGASSSRPSSSAPSSSAAPSSSSARPSSSAPQRSTSAPVSSAPPPSSSAAPTTSAPPSTSAPASTTAAPAGGGGPSGTPTTTSAAPAGVTGTGTGTANPQQHG